MLPKLCERGYEMGKAKKASTVKGTGKTATPKAASVVVVPSKRAQVLAFIAFAKANGIPITLLPGVMFAYSTIMARRHSEGAINNALGECQRYPSNAIKGRHECAKGDLAGALAWVKTLGITKATAESAHKAYVQAKVDMRAARAKSVEVTEKASK